MQGAKNEAEDYLLKDIELCERQSIQCMIQRKAVGEEKATAEGQKEETKASLSEHRKKLKGSDAEIKALEEKYNSHKAEHEVRARWRRAHTGRTRARGQQRHLTLPNFTRRRRWRGRPCPRSWRPARTSLLRTSARTSSSARTLNTGARRRRSCARASKRRAPPTGRQTTRASQSAAAKGSPALRARGPCHANAGKSRGD